VSERFGAVWEEDACIHLRPERTASAFTDPQKPALLCGLGRHVASLTDIITLTTGRGDRPRHVGLKFPQVASANVKPTGLLVTNP
jgi:hypothetical protein